MAKHLPALVGFSFLFTMLASPAWAIKDPETGVNFPNQAKCGGEQAKAVGVGVREATFGVDVYAVVVYVSPKAKGKSIRGTSECVMIRAKFVRDVGLDKIKEAWSKSFKKYGVAGSGQAKKFMSVIKKEMKKHGNMMMIVHGDKVIHKYMGASVTITGAKKLGTAIKKVYLSGGSPTPKLIKDVKSRGFAKP